eukprot:8429-Eustigmatos_ZCMA.PRE.1
MSVVSCIRPRHSKDRQRCVLLQQGRRLLQNGHTGSSCRFSLSAGYIQILVKAVHLTCLRRRP